MTDGAWADALSALGAVAMPIAVVILGFLLGQRQSRSEELVRARIDYYRSLAPDLNTLMCYMTFIGRWRDISPPEIVELKRRLDHNFYCAAPLFTDSVLGAYTDLERLCFETFVPWGEDAKIRSSAYSRRQAWREQPGWDSAWDGMFSRPDKQEKPPAGLEAIRRAHDALIAMLVRDIDLTRARSQYTTSLISLNEHAPQRQGAEGRSS